MNKTFLKDLLFMRKKKIGQDCVFMRLMQEYLPCQLFIPGNARILLVYIFIQVNYNENYNKNRLFFFLSL